MVYYQVRDGECRGSDLSVPHRLTLFEYALTSHLDDVPSSPRPLATLAAEVTIFMSLKWKGEGGTTVAQTNISCSMFLDEEGGRAV